MERYDDSQLWYVAPESMVCDRCQERQASVKFTVSGGARMMLRFADEYHLELQSRDELEASDVPGWADEWSRVCFVCTGCAEAIEVEQMHPSITGTRFLLLGSPLPGDHLRRDEGESGSGVREPG